MKALTLSNNEANPSVISIKNSSSRTYPYIVSKDALTLLLAASQDSA
jgi:hypothetical protein